MRENDEEQRHRCLEPDPIPYWTPGRRGFFLGVGLTALPLLIVWWAGWVKLFWM